jgi:hypothetical protein
MSRDDDDFEWSRPEKPAGPKLPDPHKFIDKNGNLTEAGKLNLYMFMCGETVYDDECLLTRAELNLAFTAFPLEDVSDSEIERAVKPCYHWQDDGSRQDIQIEKEDGFLRGFRARLVDKLGMTAFDPTDDESAAVEYLVDRLLPLQGVHMFVALPETLKTWLAYRFAIDVSQGRPALGRFATRQGRALIVDFEIGTRERVRRLQMLGADGRVFSTSFPPFDLTDERFWTELRKLCPSFVVIDGLGAGQSGIGELDSRFAEPLGRAARFAEQRDCTFLFLHHSPKAASLRDVESLFRGTGATRGKVDQAFYFQRLATGPNGEDRAEVVPVKTRKGVKPDSFVIQITDARGVELFNGDPLTSKPSPVTDEEKLCAAVAAEPGCSGNHLRDVLEMRRDRVSALLQGLEQTGRLRKEGKGPSTAYFATAHASCPRSDSGGDSGTIMGSDEIMPVNNAQPAEKTMEIIRT